MTLFILNLGAPLDYTLILSSGIFTIFYIFLRGIGKYTGAYWGAKITGLPRTVQKYLVLPYYLIRESYSFLLQLPLCL